MASLQRLLTISVSFLVICAFILISKEPRATLVSIDIECRPPLLTLFTTLKPKQSKVEVYRKTLRNWASLQPFIVPILYTDDSDPTFMVEEAEALGWKVFRAPEIWDGLPVLRTMFAHASQNSKTPFYGYANGDILFTSGLLETLCYVQNKIKPSFEKFIITGRRINSNYSGEPLDSSEAINALAAKGNLFFPNSEDFFITGKSSYSWSTIPRFVIGRLAFDNWIVADAIMRQIPVIDVTDTVTSLHLTDFEGREAGRFAINQTDLNRNINLVAKNFYFPLGSVICAPYETRWNAFKSPQLYYRPEGLIKDQLCTKYKPYKEASYHQYWANLCPTTMCVHLTYS